MIARLWQKFREWWASWFAKDGNDPPDKIYPLW